MPSSTRNWNMGHKACCCKTFQWHSSMGITTSARSCPSNRQLSNPITIGQRLSECQMTDKISPTTLKAVSSTCMKASAMMVQLLFLLKISSKNPKCQRPREVKSKLLTTAEESLTWQSPLTSEKSLSSFLKQLNFLLYSVAKGKSWKRQSEWIWISFESSRTSERKRNSFLWVMNLQMIQSYQIGRKGIIWPSLILRRISATPLGKKMNGKKNNKKKKINDYNYQKS